MSAAPSGSRCSRCGASRKQGDSFCWLCFSPLETAVAAQEPLSSSTVRTVRSSSAVPAEIESESSVSNPFQLDASVSESVSAGSGAALAVLLLLLFVIFLVTLVLYQTMPGVAILFGLFVVVPLFRTMIVSSHRARRGKPVSVARRIEMFLASLAVMVGLVLLWGLCAVIGLVVLCFTAVGASQGGSDPTPLIVLVGAGIVGVVLVLTSMVVWSRFRKDVDRD